MDIDQNEVLIRGLSMPHSPRWYQGRLWLLESGQGSLAVADLERGTWRTVAEVPGFTRGLDFYGPLCFIGLSQVRETAIFSGIPLVERLRERTCGVWIVHIESGETVGFLRFEAGVQEIFAVQVLPGIRFPELLEWNDERLAHSYVLPDEALALVKLPTPEELARSPAFHFQHGTKFYHEGKLAEAITAYRECLRLDPAFPNARYNLGVALGDAEEYEEAMTCLEGSGRGRAGAARDLQQPRLSNQPPAPSYGRHRALRARHRIATGLCRGTLQPGHDAPSAGRLPARSLRVRMALGDGPVHALCLPSSEMGRRPHPR
jgi:Domain of unknown function (DUF4915)/TPR repeat